MRILFGFFVLFSMTSVVPAGTPKATTHELPAALRAIRCDASRILTADQAQRIRGEGGRKFGPHHSSVKHPGNKYTGFRSGQDLGRGFGGLK